MADLEISPVQVEGEQTKSAGCPVEMYGGSCCGRRLYKAVFPGDQWNVCLMHTHDPNKDDTAFQAEFERTLQEAGEGMADFTRFVFPGSWYGVRTFEPQCIFEGARFIHAANFLGATFKRGAVFSNAEFTQTATFEMVTFLQAAEFHDVKFTEAAYFMYTEFREDANFRRSTFRKRAHFDGDIYFQGADFSKASFMEDAEFSYATFKQVADFSETTFREGVAFRGTKFREDESHAPGPVFSGARFEIPGSVTFQDTYLGQALLHDCDVARVVLSVVRWRARKNGKRMAFEEVLDLKKLAVWNLRLGQGGSDERNYGVIAELYQQLKKNYDAKCDYWTAGDFHYGEMEMKRLSSPRRNRVLRWLHPNLGLIAWYKYASEYGESYIRPALWTAVIVLVFTLLYPLTGLSPGGKQGKPPAQSARAEQSETEPSVSYTAFFEFVRGDPDGVGAGVRRFFGHSLMTTLGVAFFQRDLEYQPSYPWGRVLQWAQLLLTSSLIALFLLAVRRQFRR